MTNENGWAPPTSTPTQGQTPWSSPAASPLPAYQPPTGATPGWTPPPKPGLIPLRPLSFGTIIGSSFRVIRRNPAPTFGLSVLLYGFITIFYIALLGLVTAFTISRVDSAVGDDQNSILAGGFGLIGVSLLVPISLALVATALLQGIIALEVSRATLGEKLKVRGLWKLARGRIGTLLLWGLLLTGAIVVFLIVASVLSALVFAGIGVSVAGNGDVGGFIGALLVSFLIAAAFGVLGSWLGTKIALVPSVIMLERLTLRASIARSWQLTRKNFWRTLGTQLLIAVIIYAASYVISLPISIIATLLLTLVNPNGDADGATVGFVVLYLILGALTIVVGAVGLVMQSASMSLVYIDIRMRKEGLDLELMHYVEAKQAGTAGVENPYLRLQQAAPAPAADPTSPWA